MSREGLDERANVFFARIRARLHKGKEEYGDASFDRPVAELLDEIEQEILDIPGWTFVLWERLERLRKQVKELGEEPVT